ncbi:hypothetical protein BEH94_01270 [Candidatus Altiarchaeales archaeon WOR_SM1_SCG]|nr:hypothetical protein BEH94_01270 [Candidatus Altiarchaeales archaeon WOR_SM1_SCG]
MIIFDGSKSSGLAEKIASFRDFRLGELEIKQFPDSEIYVRVLSDVENKECAVVKSTRNNDDIIELLLILDALGDCGAKKITAVIPYLSYMRQDKRFNRGEALSARTILKLINNLSDRIITVNCHFLNKEGTFNAACYFDLTSKFFQKDMTSDSFDNIDFNEKIKEIEGNNSNNSKLIIENLDAFPVVAKYFAGKNNENNKKIVVIAPDKGALNHAKRAAEIIGCEFDYLEKTRLSGDEVKIKTKKLALKDRDVLILDDMISTGGTICTAAKVIKKSGARKIDIGCVHGVFSKGTKMFEKTSDELVCTNTLDAKASRIDVSGLIAAAL